MARVRQLNPTLRISNLRDFLPFGRQEDFDRWAEGLRKLACRSDGAQNQTRKRPAVLSARLAP